MSIEVERGLVIMKSTLCRVGSHTFVWVSGSRRADHKPPDHWSCSCGLTTWGGQVNATPGQEEGG
jgi:hypothetical protein